MSEMPEEIEETTGEVVADATYAELGRRPTRSDYLLNVTANLFDGRPLDVILVAQVLDPKTGKTCLMHLTTDMTGQWVTVGMLETVSAHLKSGFHRRQSE